MLVVTDADTKADTAYTKPKITAIKTSAAIHHLSQGPPGGPMYPSKYGQPINYESK